MGEGDGIVTADGDGARPGIDAGSGVGAGAGGGTGTDAPAGLPPSPGLAPPPGLAPSPGIIPSPGVAAPRISAPPEGPAFPPGLERPREAAAADAPALPAAGPGLPEGPELPQSPELPEGPELPEVAAADYGAAVDGGALEAAAPVPPAPITVPTPVAAPTPPPAPPAPAAPSTATPATARPSRKPRRASGTRGFPGRSAVLTTVAVVVGIIVVVFGINALTSAVGPLPDDDPGSDDGAVAESAQEAVERFLLALEAGDAQEAAELAGLDPELDPLVAQEVLDASAELAPLTLVSVDEAADEEWDWSSTVTATFLIGEEEFTRDFSVWEDDGEWTLTDAAATLPLSGLDGYGLEVNGVPVDAGDAIVLPGAYALALDAERFEVTGIGDDGDDSSAGTDAAGDGEPVVRISGPEAIDSLYGAKAGLTDAGAKTFRELVRDSLEACLADPELVTDCGFDVSADLDDGGVPVPGSAERALTAAGRDALDELEPYVDWTDPGSVSAYAWFDVTTTISADFDGERVRGELWSSGEAKRPTANLLDAEPEVVWR